MKLNFSPTCEWVPKAGLPINFNVPVLRDGIVRRVLGLDEAQA
jgi:hypothetical protein